MTAAAFDPWAPGYDAEFTESVTGRALRATVWHHLGGLFQPGQRVLELGCGTGEDAVWLACRGVEVHATDASPAMLEVAGRKAVASGVADRISFAPLNLARIAAEPPPPGDRSTAPCPTSAPSTASGSATPSPPRWPVGCAPAPSW